MEREKDTMTTNVSAYPGKWPVIAGLWIFAVGVVLFWISFFWGGAVHASDDACYVVFERNFVTADLFTALTGLICAEGLRRGQNWAVIWGGIAAGGILFLLVMDVSWNVSHDMYANFSSAMLVENVINIFCVSFGPYLIWYLLRNLEEHAHT